jgi:hypothetical protein
VIDALTTARNGLLSASAKLAGAAEAIATAGDASGRQDFKSGLVAPRIGYLPLPRNPVEAMSAMIEAQLAFKANAAVLKATADTMSALYNAID